MKSPKSHLDISLNLRVAETVTYAVVLATAAVAQNNETSKLVPSFLTADAFSHVGSDVAISYHADELYILASAPRPAGGGSFQKWRRGTGDWFEQGTVEYLAPSKPGDYMAVSAFGPSSAVAFEDGFVPPNPHPIPNAFVHTFPPQGEHQLTLSVSGSPTSLAYRLTVMAAGVPSFANDAGQVQTHHFDVDFGWQPDTPIDGQLNEGLGQSIALNEAGTIMAVGVPNSGNNGAVELYVYAAGAWAKFQTLVPPSEYDFQLRAQFGAAVAMIDDWLIVGAPKADRASSGIVIPADDVGAVMLFENDSTFHYSLTDRFQGGSADDRLGTAVALSLPTGSGGVLAAAGAPGDDLAAADAGAVLTYSLGPGGVWITGDVLLASDASNGDALGTSVGAHDRVVVAGAPNRDYLANPSAPFGVGDVGAVYVFEQVNGLFSDGFESGSTSSWSSGAP